MIHLINHVIPLVPNLQSGLTVHHLSTIYVCLAHAATMQRPAQELLLAKLAGKQPCASAPQQLFAGRPGIGGPAAHRAHQPIQHEPAVPPAPAIDRNAGQQDLNAALMPVAPAPTLPTGLPAVLPQKRKFMAAQLPQLALRNLQENKKDSKGAAAGLSEAPGAAGPLADQPQQARAASTAAAMGSDRPAKAPFRLPMLPFLSSRLRSTAEAAGGKGTGPGGPVSQAAVRAVGAAPSEGASRQQSTALPDLDVSQAFDLL
jgi:hypothetical protein